MDRSEKTLTSENESDDKNSSRKDFDALNSLPDFFAFHTEQDSEEDAQKIVYDKLLKQAEGINVSLADRMPQKVIKSFNKKYQSYIDKVISSIIEGDGQEAAITEEEIKTFSFDELEYLDRRFVDLRLFRSEVYNTDLAQKYQALLALETASFSLDRMGPLIFERTNLIKEKYSPLIEGMSPEELHLFRSYRAENEDLLQKTMTVDNPDAEKVLKSLFIEDIWAADTDYYGSEEYKNQRYKERKFEYPEIYSVGEDGLKNHQNIDDKLEKITPSDIERLQKPGEGFDDSVQTIVSYLSDLLGLDESPEVVFHQQSPDDPGLRGSYSFASNEIEFYYSDPPKESIDRDDINNTAHEMWHAYQHQMCDEPYFSPEDVRIAEQYRLNFDVYVESDLDYEGYYNQLVEVEARYFAEKFSEMFSYPGENVSWALRSKIGRIAARSAGNKKELNSWKKQ